MRIIELAVSTPVAHPGMTVEQLFMACVEAGVPGIPYRDAKGRIAGKASMRNMVKVSCLPDFMVKHHHLLGDEIEQLRIPEVKAREMATLEIDSFILDDLPQVNGDAPISKALAVMENHDTTYLFVIDDHQYHGVVTMMTIARRLLGMMEADQ